MPRPQLCPILARMVNANQQGQYTVEFDREEDGRWIADVPVLPGVMAYGATKEEALTRCKALALRVIADRLERNEATATPLDGLFIAA